MSSLYRELSYDRVVSRIHGIQFSLLGEQEIRRRSVCEVTEPRTFEGNDPVPSGLFDLRMGVIDNDRVCVTCQQRNTFCPGHFGHIVLARPCFYIQFYDIVRKLLGCVCFRCSKLLVDADTPDVRLILAKKTMPNQRRWDAVTRLCGRVKRCGQMTIDGCGARKPDAILKSDDMRLRLQWRGSGNDDVSREIILSADDVLRIFRRITDAECEILGINPKLNRPEWMICTVLPVPPPSVRPSVRHESGQRQEDDLTHKLSDIIRTNNAIKEKITKGNSFEHIEKRLLELQYNVSTLIDNSSSLYPAKDRAGRTLRSLRERLGHKEGRIRGNLMGKRVDFSARTVITPDPNLSIDELGVPLKIAMNLTFPEVVNKYNIVHMRELVARGASGYPGAKHVRKADGGRTIRLKGQSDLREVVDNLVEGDIVERHLRNGDYVLFNRQPSLHKMSMMAHRVRVMPYNTFRLNVCVCACYNADFDGDEMNMHVPQSLQTHYELKMLAAVPLHVISPRYSKPIISIVQDVALGVFRMTQGHIRVTQKQLFNLTASNPTFDVLSLKSDLPGGVVTGRQLLSTVLPPSVNVRLASDEKDADSPDYIPDDDEVIIENGVIRQGILNATVYGKESRGLVHVAYNTLGPDTVAVMLNNTQKIVCDWLVLSGFSVGISDLNLPHDSRQLIRGQLDDAKQGVYKILRDVHEGSFENVSTKSDADFLEDKIVSTLKRGEEAAGKIGRKGFHSGNNRMLNMIESGSKGKLVNFTQMLACLGGQSIENKRVPDGFDSRTLPHFTKYDDGPEARGFVEHSFIEGLTPHEFFFHSMAGRIGLIDTAVRTSETGYIQRKLIKAMEDCKVQHDLTVRNAIGHIVQFIYGEDGMNATKLEFQHLPYLSLSPAEMRGPYLLALPSEISAHSVVSTFPAERLEQHFRQLIDDRRFVIINLCSKSSEDIPIVYPVNFERIVSDNAAMFPSKSGLCEVSIDDMLDLIDRLVHTLVVVQSELFDDVRDRRWAAILARCFLSPKALVQRFHLSSRAFSRIEEEIHKTFADAIAPPGEMVGIVAAQSIGEPCTQLSQSWSSRVLVHDVKRGSFYLGPIGAFVDEHMKDPALVLSVPGLKDSEVMNLDPEREDLRVLGMAPSRFQEKTTWRRITQLSRHPPGGDLLRVGTQSGRQTTATLSHSFLRRDAERGIVPIRGDQLRVGDYVPVTRRFALPDVFVASSSSGGQYDNDPDAFGHGYLLGRVIMHGHVAEGGGGVWFRGWRSRFWGVRTRRSCDPR